MNNRFELTSESFRRLYWTNNAYFVTVRICERDFYIHPQFFHPFPKNVINLFLKIKRFLLLKMNQINPTIVTGTSLLYSFLCLKEMLLSIFYLSIYQI